MGECFSGGSEAPETPSGRRELPERFHPTPVDSVNSGGGFRFHSCFPRYLPFRSTSASCPRGKLASCTGDANRLLRARHLCTTKCHCVQRWRSWRPVPSSSRCATAFESWPSREFGYRTRRKQCSDRASMAPVWASTLCWRECQGHSLITSQLGSYRSRAVPTPMTRLPTWWRWWLPSRSTGGREMLSCGERPGCKPVLSSLTGWRRGTHAYVA